MSRAAFDAETLVTRVFAPACICKMTSEVQMHLVQLAPVIRDEIT